MNSNIIEDVKTWLFTTKSVARNNKQKETEVIHPENNDIIEKEMAYKSSISNDYVVQQMDEKEVYINDDADINRKDNSSCGGVSEDEKDKIIYSLFDAIRTLHQGQERLIENQKVLDENIRLLKDGLLRINEKQEDTIQRQHNAALKFNEDVIFKTQKGLIMELIGIADNIQMMIEDKENNPEYDLLVAVKDLAKWVDASLNNNSVKRFQDTEQDNTVYNRKRQELVEKEATDNPDENNTYKTFHPGYEWTLPYLVVNSDVQLLRILEDNQKPKMFSFVIRPEEIVKLIYKENITE